MHQKPRIPPRPKEDGVSCCMMYEHYVYCIIDYNSCLPGHLVLENGQKRDPTARRLAAGTASHCHRHDFSSVDDSLFHGLP
jgi:hypothetical protein